MSFGSPPVTRLLANTKRRPSRTLRDPEAADDAALEVPASARGRWHDRITVTALVALVALITGAVNLAYQLWPSLKSDPGIENSAEIAVLAVDRNVRYDHYVRRPGAARHSDPPDPSTYGNVVYLQMEMHGFKGKQAKLRWFTYDANNGNRLRYPFSTGHTFRAKAPTNKSISEEWVQLPRRSGTYSIRFEIYDGDDVLLAFVDTPKFTTRTIPPTSG